MSRRNPFKAGVVGALLMAATLLASCSTVGAGSSPTPEPTPPWSSYTSDRYGYSIGLPAEWEVEVQAGEFDPFIKSNPFGIGVDTVAPPGSGRLHYDGVVGVGAARLAEAMPLEEFTKRVTRNYPCRPPAAEADGTLGGVPSREVELICANGVSWIQVTAIRDGTGYVMFLASKERPFMSSRPITRQLIDSFEFVD
jgi:hypothetical protein